MAKCGCTAAVAVMAASGGTCASKPGSSRWWAVIGVRVKVAAARTAPEAHIGAHRPAANPEEERQREQRP